MVAQGPGEIKSVSGPKARSGARARRKGVQEFALELGDGDPVERILEVAKRLKADTIVMGHRGLRDIEALTLGSVSNEVSRLAPCDVVMIM